MRVSERVSERERERERKREREREPSEGGKEAQESQVRWSCSSV